MNKNDNTKLNIFIALVHQVITGVCALILPRFILTAFGSETNGLLQSVNQILSYTTLMEMGVGGVILAALYKPLAENNNDEISGIFNATKSLFKKISYVFILFSLILSLVAKFFLETNFTWSYVSGIVLILAVTVYFNYYFGLPHQLLLKADRRLFIVQSAQIITTVLNLLVSIAAIRMNANIHIVKLSSAVVYIVNPLVYRFYVRRHYNINPKAKNKNLNQRKEAVIHHLAYFIHRNTDIVIISSFLSLVNASVYSVYNAVIIVIENLLNAVSSGVAGTIGNIMAKGEGKNLKNSFELYEAVNTLLTMVIFTIAAIIILPFVKIYTSGITDVEYIQPIFACCILAAGLMCCIRIPYVSIASTAGHYKETKMGAIGEVVINLVLSLALVKPLGIIGVAIGTFAAMVFRTGYNVWYLSKNIIERPIWLFVRSLAVNLIASIGLILFINKFMPVNADSIISLMFEAVKVGMVVCPVLVGVNVAMNIKIFVEKSGK